MNQELQDRVDRLRRGIAQAQARRSVLQSRLQSCLAQAEALREKADLNRKSSEIIKTWLEDLLKSNVDSMADLVTTAFRTVFFDQSLVFKINQEPKYHRLAMSFAIEENGVENDPLSAFGGGPAVLASLVLRLAVMARLRMANLLLLDESMLAVANKYVPAAADFMKQLSEDTGVPILMVTHNEDFLSNAHVAYDAYTEKGGDGIKALRLRRRA